MVRAVVFVLMMAIGSQAAAAHKALHGYFAVGELYAMASAVRIGSGAWEGGKITGTFLGIQKIFDAGPHVYTTFGVGVSTQGKYLPGFIGGLGYSWSLWAVQIRAELNAGASVTMYSHGSALLGIAMGF